MSFSASRWACSATLMVALMLSACASFERRGEPIRWRTVFANPHVRVDEVLASPGDYSSLRRQQPGLLVSVGNARLMVTDASGEETLVDYKPGQWTWIEAAGQGSWRVLAGDAHLFFVEVVSAGQGEPPPATPIEPTHATVVDGERHLLVLDNAHVRVVDGMGGDGAVSPAHTHPPTVLVSLSKSRFRVTIGGKTRIFDFEPGMVRWTNHFEHTWRHLAGEARVIMVEIKSAHADPAYRNRN